METSGRLFALATITTAEGQQSYYTALHTLTPKAEASVGTDPVPSDISIPSYYVVIPFVIFFGLFIGAVLLQITGRAMNARRLVMVLAIAILSAATPFAVQRLGSGIGTQTTASVSTVPENISVTRTGTTVKVTWETGMRTHGAVTIVPGLAADRVSDTIIADNGQRTTDHVVEFTVSGSGMYELELFSGSIWYDNAGDPLRVVVP